MGPQEGKRLPQITPQIMGEPGFLMKPLPALPGHPSPHPVLFPLQHPAWV